MGMGVFLLARYPCISHIRQSRPDAGLGLQIKVLHIIFSCPLFARRRTSREVVSGLHASSLVQIDSTEQLLVQSNSTERKVRRREPTWQREGEQSTPSGRDHDQVTLVIIYETVSLHGYLAHKKTHPPRTPQ